MRDATLDEKKSAAIAWNSLAVEAEGEARLGIRPPSVANARADTYRRAAKAIEMEIETGIAVCSCCFKPFGEGTRILISSKG